MTDTVRKRQTIGYRRRNPMVRAFVLLLLIGAAAYAVTRFMAQPEGSFRKRAAQAAASVREHGPGAVQDVAYGIEKAGEAAEGEAKTLRQRKEASGQSAENASNAP
jgi:hypothetical protein